MKGHYLGREQPYTSKSNGRTYFSANFAVPAVSNGYEGYKPVRYELVEADYAFLSSVEPFDLLSFEVEAEELRYGASSRVVMRASDFSSVPSVSL